MKMHITPDIQTLSQPEAFFPLERYTRNFRSLDAPFNHRPTPDAVDERTDDQHCSHNASFLRNHQVIDNAQGVRRDHRVNFCGMVGARKICDDELPK